MTAVNPIPNIYDTARRVWRTVIQTGVPAFLGFAGVLPAILGAVKVYVSPQLYGTFLVIAGGITTVAAIITRIMAIPAVNKFLARFKLAGHSGDVTPLDSYTTMTPIQSVTSSGEDAGGTSAN